MSVLPDRLRVLVAEDDPLLLQVLEKLLTSWGYEAVLTRDGVSALKVMTGADPPVVAILDWGIPEPDGLEICRQVRKLRPDEPPYLILLTGRGAREDLVTGLEGGADEYLAKPANPAELRARLQAASRIVELRARLAERVRELEEAPLTRDMVGPEHAGLRQTLRLCAATFTEALTLPLVPRHLRIALRTSRALCLETLGEADQDYSSPPGGFFGTAASG